MTFGLFPLEENAQNAWTENLELIKISYINIGYGRGTMVYPTDRAIMAESISSTKNILTTTVFTDWHHDICYIFMI